MKKYDYFEVPTQVQFWDYKNGYYNGGIAYRDEIICGCANYGAKCTDCCREFWLHEVE